MNDDPKPSQECCGGRCRWCTEWRDPETKWCETCQATVYVSESGACIPCAPIEVTP